MLHIFDYPFDEQEITRKYFDTEFEIYKDSRWDKFNEKWQIAKVGKWDYADELCKKFEIDGHPRFYYLGAGQKLLPHIDNGTKCSINFVLGDDYAPIIVDNKEYMYKSALLNCQVIHSVPAFHKDRRLFKLSIFDKSYDEVLNIIKDSISVE